MTTVRARTKSGREVIVEIPISLKSNESPEMAFNFFKNNYSNTRVRCIGMGVVSYVYLEELTFVSSIRHPFAPYKNRDEQ